MSQPVNMYNFNSELITLFSGLWYKKCVGINLGDIPILYFIHTSLIPQFSNSYILYHKSRNTSVSFSRANARWYPSFAAWFMRGIIISSFFSIYDFSPSHGSVFSCWTFTQGYAPHPSSTYPVKTILTPYFEANQQSNFAIMPPATLCFYCLPRTNPFLLRC